MELRPLTFGLQLNGVFGRAPVADCDAHAREVLTLPAVPYDASDKHSTMVSSLPLVRYCTNDYSVPVAYGHRDVLVQGYCPRNCHKPQHEGHSPPPEVV